MSIGFHRIFYVMSGATMVLLHAYQKDTQKAPESELKLAEKRMKAVLGR